jgi:muramoyltetrapeptide carboxypeptidase LdcA involved in peptidoglycan recycling
VLASIGGDDQIKVLRHLDPDVLRAHPKPFFGFSDNTNLLNYLFNLGIPSFHGGSVMLQFGRAGHVHPVSEASLRAALFTTGPWEVPEPTDLRDEHGDWATDDLTAAPSMRPADPWTWHGPSGPVTGTLWGGNLEILDWTLGVGRHVLPVEQYAGCVLFLETSEELPSDDEVYRMLMVMGERGLLQQFAGLVFARPKAWSPEKPTEADRTAYTDAQRAAVTRAMAEYHPDVPVVIGVDAGHADPMVVMPIGNEITLDPATRKITVTY